MDKYELAFNEWHEKTNWVQDDKRFDVLLPWGKHRADVMKEYIDLLESRVADMAVQLANSESKRRELAAENVGIKEAIPQLKNIDYQNENMDDVTWAEEIGFDAAVMATHGLVPKTQATDSFLDEVRASAVEEFLRDSQLPYQIATVLADYDNADDATLQTVIWSGQPPEPDGDVWHLEYVSRGNAIVRAVLKELRKGASL